MEKVRVTIIGIGALHEAKGSLTVGEVVDLTKEPDNPHDSNAIKVTYKGADVGYVGNADGTVKADTYSAKKVQGFLAETAQAEIVEEVWVRFKNRDSKGFIAEILPPKEEKKEEPVTEIVFKLEGTTKVHRKRLDVIKMVNAGSGVVLELNLSGDKVQAEYDGESCGFVEKKHEEAIKKLMGDSGIATPVKVSGTSLICSYKVSEKQIEKVKSVRNLKATIKWVLDEGLDTEESLKEKVAYLNKYKVSERAQCNLFASYVNYPKEVESKIPQRPKTLYQDNSGIVKKSVAYMNIRRNLMFEGDRGVGKNVLTETLCWLYKRPLFEFSLNSQHDNNSLLGGKVFEDTTTTEELGVIQKSFSRLLGWYKPISAFFKGEQEEEAETTRTALARALTTLVNKQEMSFEASVIVLAAEYGGVIVFDEFNTSLAHVMSLFNALLDDRRRITVPGYDVIEAHKNFLAIGTQNKDYTGTFDANEATVDRFVPIIFPTLTSIEDVLMAKIPGVSMATVKSCQALFKGLKKAVEEGEVSEKALTIRGFIDACMATEEDIPLKEALIDNIANRANDIDDRKSIRHMIDVQVL